MVLTFSKNTRLIRDTFEGVDDDIELVEDRGTGRTLIAGNIAHASMNVAALYTSTMSSRMFNS